MELALKERGYSLVKKIRSGGYGDIFLLNSTKYNISFVAKQIKIPKSSKVHQIIEVDNLACLDHPNIIKLYEYFTLDDSAIIIFEYCENGSLDDIIKKGGAIHPPKLYLYARQLASSLFFCHSKNIAHRDIKPANVLVDSYERLKLGDFGLSAKIRDGERCNKLTGSYLFMAPEIIGNQDFDPFAADVYALGITFYIMATGSPPWRSSNVDTLRKLARSSDVRFPAYIDRDFSQLIRAMINPDPEKRIKIQDVIECPKFKSVNQAISLGSIAFNLNAISKNQDFNCSASDENIVKRNRNSEGNVTHIDRATNKVNINQLKSFKSINQKCIQVSKKRTTFVKLHDISTQKRKSDGDVNIDM